MQIVILPPILILEDQSIGCQYKRKRDGSSKFAFYILILEDQCIGLTLNVPL